MTARPGSGQLHIDCPFGRVRLPQRPGGELEGKGDLPRARRRAAAAERGAGRHPRARAGAAGAAMMFIPTRGPRIVLYGHDTVGLGHLRRNLTIAHRLARDLPQAHFLALTGSSQAHAFPLPPRMDFVKIPSATQNRDGLYQARSLDLPLGELRDMRSRLIAETLRSYRPDLVLVDHAPAG